MSYRSELNGYMPLFLIQPEYAKHLTVSLHGSDAEAYVANQDIEDLLNKEGLMKQIQYEIMEKSLSRQCENLDEDCESTRIIKHHKPSKDIDYD